MVMPRCISNPKARSISGVSSVAFVFALFVTLSNTDHRLVSHGALMWADESSGATAEASENPSDASSGDPELTKLRGQVARLEKEIASLREKNKELDQELNDLLNKSRQFGDYLERQYFDEKNKKYIFDGANANPQLIRSDDSVIDATPGFRMTLVYFTDITCPNCEVFDRYLEEVIKPLFRGHLRIVYKHFPRHDQEKAEPMHKALEAARVQGKFWEMKARLMDRPTDDLVREEYIGYADDLGLDLEAFERDMEAPQAMTRIRQDVAWGRRIGVTATPSIFLNGRRVDKSMRQSLMFWTLRSEALKRSRDGQNQEW